MDRNKEKPNLHYVCTMEEAKKLIEKEKEFWLGNCGCREKKGECKRSRIDICLQFKPSTAAEGHGLKKITKKDLQDIILEAGHSNLVARPFRDYETRTITEGICFCCDDCCSYFLNKDELCDKGAYIEKTDFENCIHCGGCVTVCFFKARKMEDNKLVVNRDACYGCGLCVAVCPVDCIEMIKRI